MLEINNCVATITNVNPRKENHGDEKEPAFDINFNIVVLAECIKGLYSDDFIKSMWSQEDGKGNRFHNIHTIGFDNEFEKGRVTIQESTGHKITYNDCKIKKFKIRPRQQQMVEIWFQVQHKVEDEEEILTALRCLKMDEGVQVTIEAADPDPTKNKKNDDGQVDAFPNGGQEDDPFEGSDLEANKDDPEEAGDNSGNILSGSWFADFDDLEDSE